MKWLLFILLLASCQFKEAPEVEIVPWTLLKMDTEYRNGKEIEVQIWEAKGVEYRITGQTGFKVGTVMYWPVSR